MVDGSNAMQIGDLADDRNATAALGGPAPPSAGATCRTGLGVTVQSLERAIYVQDAVVATDGLRGRRPTPGSTSTRR